MKGAFQILFCSIFHLFSIVGNAQQFSAKPSKTEVGKNERFTVTFSLNERGRNFRAPDLINFRVEGGPNQSSQTQIINGRMSQNYSWSFILKPRQTGVFTIGAATVDVDGKTLRSQPFTVKVVPQSERPKDPNDPYAKAEKSAFFRIPVSNTRPFVGEPIVASYKFYFNVDIDNPALQDQPDFTGFYKENIDIGRVKTSEETYQNQRFTTAIIQQMVLIPQRNGSISSGTVEFEIPTSVPTGRRTIFGPETRRINLNAEQYFPTINVRALPEKDKPSGFAGAVGDYNMEVNLSRNELTANESATLTIKISGQGNLKLIEPPQPEIPNAFEIYDPKITEKIAVNSGGMGGTKTYEYLLIPRYGGTYKIPEIQFHYFDPKRERYVTESSEPMEITVTGAPSQPNENGIASSEKETVGFIGKDILYIKTDAGKFHERGARFLNSPLFVSLLGGMGFAFAGMLGFFYLKNRGAENQQLIRSQKASKEAKRRLAKAKKELEKESREAFYNELSAALWGYFSDKFSISQSQLSKDFIKEKLLEKGIAEETAEQATATMNRAEMARFTAASSTNPREDYEATARLLTEIDRKV